ncbi:hypothetical protein [Ottowia sp.]|uniref:hypothetical protein n=1 Tax=Ottowia sp. TaxID=1898956 RepID=UPI0025DA0821|nr:hypothetical protein [Ottowia sp.]MBK6616381.1 hypothetical protein [Ottowia sp.]
MSDRTGGGIAQAGVGGARLGSPVDKMHDAGVLRKSLICVEFPEYMSDGPSYCGRVCVELDGRRASLVTFRGAEKAEERVNVLLSECLPAVVSVFRANADVARLAWMGMDASDLAYYETPEFVPHERMKGIVFEGGLQGAVLLHGEACFATLYVFEPAGTRALTLDFESFVPGSSAQGAVVG